MHGSWRHRIAVFVSELRKLYFTSKELWQLSCITLNRSGFDNGEDIGGERGVGRLLVTICGLVLLLLLIGLQCYS
jgi:hypothetical protein